jgi:hypothetical protein
MSGTTVQSAPAGFFQGFQVDQTTAQDLISATADALSAATSATASAASASTQATAALTAANAAQSSLASVGTSVTAAAASATSAASSASAASTSATNAAASSSSATTSASSATTSASSASGSASTASTAATNAGASATAAAASQTAAAASATSAAASATTAQTYGSAILNNSALTGTPTAPTATALTNSTRVATTAYADAAVGVENTRALAAEALKAPLASPTLTGTPAAPTAAALTNTTQLATTAFVTAAASVVTGQAMENVGRNVVHNGEFLVQQRGVGAFTGVAYTADRWLQAPITSACSTTLTALSDADRTAIGDEAALWTHQSVVTGSAGAGDHVVLNHRLESAKRYAGKSITVSFWAKAASGTPSIGVGASQNFGAGGSPSAEVDINATAVALSTTWTRYSVTIALPSTSGKTMGTTAGTDYTGIRFWYSSGATNNTLAGGIGVQSPTVSLWGVQAEVGTVATTFEKKSYGQHLADCQRFFFAITTWIATIGTYVTTFAFPVTMRTSPAVTGGGTGFNQAVLNAQGVAHGQTTGGSQAMTYSADL